MGFVKLQIAGNNILAGMKNTKDGIELMIITSKARTDKAMNTLKGIILGILADNQITQEEIDELELWVSLHKMEFLRHPFNELLRIIEDMLNGSIEPDELKDIYWLCQKYESDNYYYSALTTDLQELQGYCHGILADGVINATELNDLNNWIEKHEHLNGHFPYDELKSILLSITKDGIYTKEERDTLELFFTSFIDLQNQSIINQDYTQGISYFCSSEPNIIFDGKSFCLTGEFTTGKKSIIKQKIVSKGGRVVTNISNLTDYLVVGDSGNKAWAFACYGRKVEQAIALRKSGAKLTLVHELDFLDYI